MIIRVSEANLQRAIEQYASLPPEVGIDTSLGLPNSGFGRQVVIGMRKAHGRIRPDPFLVYILTGRSPGSRGRKISQDGQIPELETRLYTEPTSDEWQHDPRLLRELLFYNAMAWTIHNNRIIAICTNGRTTSTAFTRAITGNFPEEGKSLLQADMETWDYEPDKDVYTSRVLAAVGGGTHNSRELVAELGIIRRNTETDGAIREVFPIELVPGQAHMLGTYDGRGPDSGQDLYTFDGKPVPIQVTALTQETIAQQLLPWAGKLDNLVSVAVLMYNTQEARFEDPVVLNYQV